MIDFLKGAWWTLKGIAVLCAWVYLLVSVLGKFGVYVAFAVVVVTACAIGGMVRHGYEKDMKELK